MRSRVALIGLVGGAAVSAALYYPGTIWLPGLFVEDWSPGNIQLAWAGGILALLLLLVTGLLAGRFSGANSRLGGAYAGCIAGWIAGMVAFATQLAPAAGVIGMSAIFKHGLKVVEDDMLYIRLLLEAVNSILLWTTLAMWVASIAGLLFGALGGMVIKPSRTEQGFFVELILPLAVYGIFSGAVNYFITTLVLPLMESVMLKTAETANFPVPFSMAHMVEIPLLTTIAWILFWQIIIWRHLQARRRDAAERRLFPQVVGYTSLVIPLLLIVLIFLLDREHFLSFHLPVGIVMLIVGSLAARLAWKERSLLKAPPAPAQIPGMRRLLQIGLALVGVILLSGYLGLLSGALNIVLLPIISIDSLIPEGASSFTAAQMVSLNYHYHFTVLWVMALGFSFYFFILLWVLHNLQRYWVQYGNEIIRHFRARGKPGEGIDPQKVPKN